jgi:hypothetical protein
MHTNACLCVQERAQAIVQEKYAQMALEFEEASEEIESTVSQMVGACVRGREGGSVARSLSVGRLPQGRPHEE